MSPEANKPTTPPEMRITLATRLCQAFGVLFVLAVLGLLVREALCFVTPSVNIPAPPSPPPQNAFDVYQKAVSQVRRPKDIDDANTTSPKQTWTDARRAGRTEIEVPFDQHL